MAQKEFEGLNVIAVEGSTECPGTGNSGETRIAWSNERATVWKVKVSPGFLDDDKLHIINDPDYIEIILHGDQEARTFIESLEYMAEELREQYEMNN